jgi:glycosyltransferase involved in cell wall biosynthesis
MRNYAGLPFADVQFKKVFDLYKIPAHFYFRLFNKVVPRYINRFNDCGLNSVDLYHFFNSITPVKKPWVVTFETTIPRLDPDFRRGLDWMAGKYCKKIIGYTKRAIDAQNYYLDKHSEYREAIQQKMMLLYPSQKPIVENIFHKEFDKDIVFTITGSVFFLKGGWELLQVFERLRVEKAPVRLNVVSRLEVHGYKDAHATPELVTKSKKILISNPLIRHYDGLPNSDVLKLLKESHVGILPSYGETFGYSLLEAMACGCAAVSSSVSPFPEFIQDPWGWLVDIPTKKNDGLEYTDTDNLANHKLLSEALIEGLYSTIKHIIADRNLLRDKCSKAIQRIKDFHGPMDRVQVLCDIYKNAIN